MIKLILAGSKGGISKSSVSLLFYLKMYQRGLKVNFEDKTFQKRFYEWTKKIQLNTFENPDFLVVDTEGTLEYLTSYAQEEFNNPNSFFILPSSIVNKDERDVLKMSISILMNNGIPKENIIILINKINNDRSKDKKIEESKHILEKELSVVVEHNGRKVVVKDFYFFKTALLFTNDMEKIKEQLILNKNGLQGWFKKLTNKDFVDFDERLNSCIDDLEEYYFDN